MLGHDQSGISVTRLLVAGGLFFLPYMFLRPATILFTLSDSLFVLGALFLFAGRGVSLSPFGSLTPYWYAGVTLMLGALLISSIAHDAADRWLSVAMQYAFSFVCLPMILLNGNRERWLSFVRAFVAGVVIMEILTFSILIYYDWSFEALRGRFGPEFLTGMGRVSGFLGGANLHSAMLCMCLPFVFYLRATRKMPLPVFAIAVGLICAGVFYSASFTGFITLFVVTVAFVVIGRVRIPIRLAAGLTAMVVAYFGLGAPTPSAFEKRVGPALRSIDLEQAGTFGARVDLITEAWTMADKTMVIGVGADQYRLMSEFDAPVHNSYMLLWVEGGFPALVGWLAILGILGLGGVLIRRQSPLDAAVGLSVFAVFLIFSVTAAHMYARVWIAPVLLALAPAFSRLHALAPAENSRGLAGKSA